MSHSPPSRRRTMGIFDFRFSIFDFRRENGRSAIICGRNSSFNQKSKIKNQKSLLPVLLSILFAAGVAFAADDPAATQMDFANGLFQRGFYQEAAKEYRTYLDQYPKGVEALTAMYRLG